MNWNILVDTMEELSFQPAPDQPSTIHLHRRVITQHVQSKRYHTKINRHVSNNYDVEFQAGSKEDPASRPQKSGEINARFPHKIPSKRFSFVIFCDFFVIYRNLSSFIAFC